LACCLDHLLVEFTDFSSADVQARFFTDSPTALSGSMFPFVIQISEIVMERERKLRQALATMGMHDLSYWLSWHLFLTSVAMLFGFFIYVFGCIFQFRLFLKNGLGAFGTVHASESLFRPGIMVRYMAAWV
jgi:ABC-type multidrug transport system permease subunit